MICALSTAESCLLEALFEYSQRISQMAAHGHHGPQAVATRPLPLGKSIQCDFVALGLWPGVFKMTKGSALHRLRQLSWASLTASCSA
jgi:hypothetical protein